MNKDQLSGRVKELVGELQVNIGYALGDIRREANGYALEQQGKIQKHRGDARNAFDSLVKKHFKV